MYCVEILVNGEMEAGENAVLGFESFEGATKFLFICLENGYSAEITKLSNEEE